MKNKFLAILSLVLVAFFAISCGQDKKPNLVTSDDSVAYVIGTNIGSNIKRSIESDSLNLNYELLVKGFKDAINGIDSTYLSKEVKEKVMMSFQHNMQEKQMKKMQAVAGVNKAAGAKFLAENKSKEGVVETSSGLQYKIIKAGKGKTPAGSDKVTVNYEGKLIDGTVFDSSYGKDPISFPLNGVIKGWTEGLQLMKEGGTSELYIPSDLAYGDQGNPSIPGGSTLIFKVELIKVEPQAQSGQGK